MATKQSPQTQYIKNKIHALSPKSNGTKCRKF